MNTVLYNAGDIVYYFERRVIIVLKRGVSLKRFLPEEECEKNEKRFAEDAWLNYFNRYLYEHGTISEKEYKKMTEKIAERASKLSRKKSAV